MKKLLLIPIILIITSFSVLGIVGHPAAQVFPGLFASGNYTFDGNVGIGVIDPVHNLEIEDESNTYFKLINPGGTGNSLMWWFNSTNGANFYMGQVNENDALKIYNYLANELALVITSSNDISIGSDRLFIDNTSNVGIGTIQPEVELEVHGSIVKEYGVIGGGRVECTGGIARIDSTQFKCYSLNITSITDANAVVSYRMNRAVDDETAACWALGGSGRSNVWSGSTTATSRWTWNPVYDDWDIVSSSSYADDIGCYY